MGKQEKKIISVNWQAFGDFLSSILRFLKWPVTLLAITYLVVTIPDYSSDLGLDYRLILQYLDVIIWPLVTLGIIWIIKPYLPKLIDRVEEFNLLGNKAKFTKTQKQDASVTDTKADELKEIDSDAPKPATNTNTDFQVADNETHGLLTSYDAATAYAKIYQNIFGTQIEVLRRLVDYIDGLGPEDFSDILEKHQGLSGGKGFKDIIPYMQFLRQNTLVIYNPETKTYRITNAGYYFLVFLYKAEILDDPKDW